MIKFNLTRRMFEDDLMDSNTFIISQNEEGFRLDKLLSDKFQLQSRTYFQNLIQNGGVLLNGAKVKKRTSLKMGDEVQIFFQALPDQTLKPQNIPLNILYEDEHLLAINKPSGMVVHPAPGNWSYTFVNALLFHCKNIIDIDSSLRPGIVHRLDKETSGILLAAKNIEAHQKLIRMFQERKMEKVYIGISCGKPKTFHIDARIGRHPIKRKEMAILEKGKEATTDLSILAFDDEISLLLIVPKTGRTHQIRVHLKHINCPLLGDNIYGNVRCNKRLNAKRHLLHAYKLKFNHPITSEYLELLAPMPEDFKQYFDRFAEKEKF